MIYFWQLLKYYKIAYITSIYNIRPWLVENDFSIWTLERGFGFFEVM